MNNENLNPLLSSLLGRVINLHYRINRMSTGDFSVGRLILPFQLESLCMKKKSMAFVETTVELSSRQSSTSKFSSVVLYTE